MHTPNLTRRTLLLSASVGALGLAAGLPAPALAKSGVDALAVMTPGAAVVVDHSALDRLLAAFVVAGKDGINRVDYPRFKVDGLVALKSYLAALQAVDPSRLGGPEHFAYFANLYNAATLEVVLEHYPVTSIKKVRLGDAGGVVHDGPWKTPLVGVNGVRLSLDQIAGAVLRPTFMMRDPRGHYLLNCLSIGCPNLLPEAITGARLERQLSAAAEAFVRHPRGLDVRDGRAKSSSLYAWYEADFGGAAGVIAHMRQVGGPAVAAKLEGITAIADHDYDWALADAST